MLAPSPERFVCVKKFYCVPVCRHSLYKIVVRADAMLYVRLCFTDCGDAYFDGGFGS